MDKPGTRKRHSGSIPLTGGIAIACACVLTGFIVAPWSSIGIGLAVGALLMLAVGVFDDRFEIRARYRFAAQVAAGISIVYIGGDYVQDLGEVFGPGGIGLNVFAVPFTIIAIAGLANALNMSDGLDGLCGGHVLIAMFWLILAAARIGDNVADPALFAQVGAIVLPILGALVAFMILNSRYFGRSHAAVFMGDGGSMSLGVLLAWFTIHLSATVDPYLVNGLEPISAVWIVAVPLADMFACMVRRLKNRITPMSADRQHLHHMLLEMGLTHHQTVVAIHLLALASGAIGFFGWVNDVPAYYMFWSLIAIIGAYSIFAIRFWAQRADLAEVDVPTTQVVTERQ